MADAVAAVEIQTNCPACNKPVKRLRRYYRNGKFFCTKKCWRKASSTTKEESNAKA